MILKYAALIVAYIVACMAVAWLGSRRKWGFWGYLWSAVLFTPVLGLLFLLAADPPPKRIRGKTDEPVTQ